MNILGCEHIGIIAKDTESLAQWYNIYFGANEVLRSPDDMAIIFLSLGDGSLIELIPGEKDFETSSQAMHLCFSVDNLDSAIKKLQEKGIEPEQPPNTAFDESRIVFFRDPENNRIQLVERISKSPIHRAVYKSD